MIELINSNFSYAVLSLLLITILFHLPFIFGFNLSKRGWKYIDYFWIGLTAIGLVATTRDVERWISNAKTSALGYHIKFQRSRLIEDTDINNKTYICTQFQKGKFSPINLEEINKEYLIACEWIKIVHDKIIKTDTTNFVIIKASDFPKFNPKEKELYEYKNDLYASIDNYNKIVDERMDLIKISQDNKVDLNILFFSPLLLIIGLSIRLTKVTGEILLEK
jgi:hypothetical protein